MHSQLNKELLTWRGWFLADPVSGRPLTLAAHTKHTHMLSLYASAERAQMAATLAGMNSAQIESACVEDFLAQHQNFLKEIQCAILIETPTRAITINPGSAHACPEGFLEVDDATEELFDEMQSRGFGERTANPALDYDEVPGPFRYALAERGKLVSGLETEPYLTIWGDSVIPMESLGGVVAPLEARRQGKTQVLLRQVLGAMRERGTPLSTITTPFSYPFYRRAGFEYAFLRRRYTFPPQLLLGLKDVPSSLRYYPGPRRELAVPYQLAILYELALAPMFQGYARRTPFQWASHLAGRNTDVYIWDGPEGPCAYAIIAVTPHHIAIRELLATTDIGLQGLLKALASLDSQTQELVWDAVPTYHLDRWVVEPDRVKTELTPEGTFRIIDIKTAMETRRFHWTGEGHIALSIEDNVCEWNTGTWTLSFDQGHAQATRVPTILSESDCGSLDVRAFGLLYAGSIRAEEAVRYYGARLSTKQQDLLDRVIFNRQPLLLESF
ncbi:MAG: hypothetical protein C7B45_07150 [Sulfobacillus acidophilus]|uniref:N-acetyltransferase domain-containing protein n=1 Tax=Sulfobacillus acidophilus TaxID=53633 RepID=A0A2T2WJH7_9FIRM|nr:MAG: hypothetical protein C7B45_07150 [Sulfobacillus acidophilus]